LSTPEGLLVLDKPAGMTSHDVVARVRRLAGTSKVGHAGTLDPMATGVLVLGLGRATRLLGHLALHDKDYLATIRLGAATVTDDAEGEVTSTADPVALAGVCDEAVAAGIAALTGALEQVPSAVSAVKVDGRRSYARVRAGEDVVLKARSVTVSSFTLLERRGADLDVAVTCTTGTYVRALARDLGLALGVGGHLSALRRTRVGGFRDMRTLEQPLEPIGLDEAVALSFPRRELTEQEAGEIRFGRPLMSTRQPGVFGAFSPEGQALALLEDRKGLARPVLVLAPAL
jgi:tRNA pseudouridine55 synthase